MRIARTMPAIKSKLIDKTNNLKPRYLKRINHNLFQSNMWEQKSKACKLKKHNRG